MNSLSGQLALPSLCASGMALGGMAKWQVAKNVFISVCFSVCVWGAFKFFHFPRGALFSVPATEQPSSRAAEQLKFEFQFHFPAFSDVVHQN